MYPTSEQERQMLLHCAHARYVWVRREVAPFKWGCSAEI
ncbi:helix-turn-helix domain-containing protein [Streptomyces cavernae]|nr:helix-turn-helix domain-containing protein [Streptomyces cavernae]